MKKQLEKIFIHFNLAKLAYSKGFRQWCACIAFNENDYRPNFIEKVIDDNLHGKCLETFFDLEDTEFEIGESHYYCPTHLQLISWLSEKYDIQVTLKVNGMWKVIAHTGHTIYNSFSKTEFEINEAIEIALNLLDDFKKETPTEV